jgi:hypothetical protein
MRKFRALPAGHRHDADALPARTITDLLIRWQNSTNEPWRMARGPGKMSYRSDRISKIMFFASLVFLVALLAFAYGILVASRGLWPHQTLRILIDHLRSVYVAGEWQPAGRFVRAPAGAARERVVVHRPELFEAGYRAIMGWNGESYGIWLIDPDGQDVHYWPIDYQALDPGGPSTQEPHGMKVLEDASILVNFDGGDVLARLDACGQPIWVKRGIYHHSIDRADDGSFWTWRADDSAYGPYQYLVNFDPQSGDAIQEYSLIEDFIDKAPENRQIFAVPGGYTYARGPAESGSETICSTRTTSSPCVPGWPPSIRISDPAICW